MSSIMERIDKFNRLVVPIDAFLDGGIPLSESRQEILNSAAYLERLQPEYTNGLVRALSSLAYTTLKGEILTEVVIAVRNRMLEEIVGSV